MVPEARAKSRSRVAICHGGEQRNLDDGHCRHSRAQPSGRGILLGNVVISAASSIEERMFRLLFFFFPNTCTCYSSLLNVADLVNSSEFRSRSCSPASRRSSAALPVRDGRKKPSLEWHLRSRNAPALEEASDVLKRNDVLRLADERSRTMREAGFADYRPAAPFATESTQAEC